MPVYTIETPSGKQLQIEAPDEATALQGAQDFEAGKAQVEQPPVQPSAGAPPAESEGIRGTRSFAQGLADMATFGFADEAAAGVGTLGGMLPGGHGKGYDQLLAEIRGQSASDAAAHPTAHLAGQVTGVVGNTAGMVRGGLSLGAQAMNSGMRLPAVSLGSAADGLVVGGLQGFGSGEGLSDRLQKAESGAKWGAALGGVAPAATAGISNLVSRAITPFRTSPERIAAAQVLQQEGVPITAGQRTGSNGLRYAESELGGARAAQMMEDQSAAFTDAAMRRAGANGRATSDNMLALRDRLGQGFDDISARNAVRLDQRIVRDINGARTEYSRVLPSEQRNIFGNLANEIVDRFQTGGGVMSGQDYQTIRSRLSRMAQSNRQRDPEFADAIRSLRNALDGGMNRSIHPQDIGQWAQLRREYGNMKVLERAANGGGENAGLGLITPAQLRIAAKTGNRGGYARGEGDFAELAKAGQAIMTPLPNSGTASRSAVRNLGVPFATSGLGGAIAGIPGALIGAAVPRATGALMMSRPGQAFLGNQVLGQGIAPRQRALLNALIAGGSSTAAARR